ncbi:hypothetical protein PR048_007056 [Dryococelus australis]|uniref:Uncharacterized protein n=1 Tax=Dryococelus australis TaxID=614101 RepID=A0ABQ9ICK4_9NEOP|nr:hypothetical protein PR048_007056 [Dryococelus australis]
MVPLLLTAGPCLNWSGRCDIALWHHTNRCFEEADVFCCRLDVMLISCARIACWPGAMLCALVNKLLGLTLPGNSLAAEDRATGVRYAIGSVGGWSVWLLRYTVSHRCTFLLERVGLWDRFFCISETTGTKRWRRACVCPLGGSCPMLATRVRVSSCRCVEGISICCTFSDSATPGIRHLEYTTHTRIREAKCRDCVLHVSNHMSVCRLSIDPNFSNRAENEFVYVDDSKDLILTTETVLSDVNELLSAIDGVQQTIFGIVEDRTRNGSYSTNVQKSVTTEMVGNDVTKCILKTLDIRQRMLHYTFDNKSELHTPKPDMRGRKSPPNKTPEERNEEYQLTVSSCGIQNISNVYRLYCEYAKENNFVPIKEQYAMYDLTFYENSTREGFCYLWGECDGKGGANKICSVVFDYCTVDARGHVKEVTLYCDSCPGQNKTRQMWLRCSKKIICAPSEWPTIVRNRIRPGPYNVIVLTHRTFRNLRELQETILPDSKSRNKEGNRIMIRAVGNNIVNVFTSFDEQAPGLPVHLKMYHKTTQKNNFPLPRTYYSAQLSISMAKYKDLNNLFSKGAIPINYHSEYKYLPKKNGIPDCLNEADGRVSIVLLSSRRPRPNLGELPLQLKSRRQQGDTCSWYGHVVETQYYQCRRDCLTSEFGGTGPFPLYPAKDRVILSLVR